MTRFPLPIYAYSLLNETVFIYSFYAVMFSDRGLGAMEISILFAVWSTVGLMLEVPSGALADKYSRKGILLFAQGAKICCFLSWMLFPCFWGFLAGFVFWGVRSAFSSGTFEALVFDELKSLGAEHSYAKVIGRTRSLSTIGILIADASAVYMVRFGYRFMILASLVSLAASIIALLFIRPAEQVESTGEAEYFTLLKEGVREAIRNRVVLRLIGFISFAMIFGTLDEYWVLFYNEAGIPRAGIAVLCAVVTASQVTAGVVAHRFSRLPDRGCIAMYLAAGLCLLIGAWIMRPISVLCIPILSMLLAVVDIVLETRLQHSIQGRARATVLSVRGFSVEVGAVIVFLGFGTAAGGWGYGGGFVFFAALMVLIGVMWLALGGKSPFGGQRAVVEAAEREAAGVR